MKSKMATTGGRSPLSIALSAVLVLGSVLGAWLFIESTKTTEVFLITKQGLASGAPLNLQNLERVELSLFGLTGAYLKPETLLAGAYLERPVGQGEAIPLSAVTTREQQNWSNLVITPEIPVSSQVSVGSKVAIWAAPLLEFQSYGEPVLLAVDVEVVAIVEPQGGFSGQQVSLELRVPNDTVQFLLGALANKAQLFITATGGSS